ncbi:hypothetical protein [Sphingobacterium sp.]|uniref:hypothetical protein n=1 Tax=Sphingobacterium sp. TaxID=341027 RepID=UPI002FDDA1FB
MFNKLSEDEILEKLDSREIEITVLAKLPLLNNFYLSFLARYEGVEIIADIAVFSYEEALKENHYLETNYPDISSVLWIFGRSGQGDEWFISKENGTVWFYDHDRGAYSDLGHFVDFNISFLEFLQLAFLYRDLENLLDEQDDEINEQNSTDFKEKINSIESNLFELYPYQYF